MRNGIWIAVLPALALAGCARPLVDRVALVERRALGRALEAYEAPHETDGAPRRPPEEPRGPLTLREALALALLHNPDLAHSAWELRVAEAKMLQAGLGPNPELEAGLEGFGGTRDKRGIGGAEATLSLGYTVELGGKRLKRLRAAEAQGRLAAWDYEAKRLDVLTATTKAFVEVLAAQERVALQEQLAALAEQALRNVAEQVAAGKLSPIEQHKAWAELALARIAREQARHRLAAARRRLATAWGGAEPAFERAAGSLEDGVSDFDRHPDWAALAALLRQNPDVDRWADELAQRQAALELEKANRIADLKLAPGLGYFGDSNAFGWLFGLALPLGLRNRNEGAILEAGLKVAQAGEERRAAESRALAQLAEACGELAAAAAEARGIKADVLPAAQAAFDAASQGFRQGKFRFIEVLDAQRTLFEAHGNLIKAQAEYQKALADLERLIGQSILLGGKAQPPTGSQHPGGSVEKRSQR